MHRSLIVDKLNTSSMSLTDLSQKIGFDPNTFQKFIAGKIELDFETVLKVVQEIAPDQEFEIMKLYIHDIQGKENLICAMEYCSTNRLFETLYNLLENLKMSAIEELKTWAYLYQCFYEYQVDKLPNDIILEKLDNFNPLTKEMRVFKNIICFYLYHYNLKKFKQSLTIAKECSEDLYFLNEGFIKNSYNFRIHYVLAKTHLELFGEIKEARIHASKVFESTYSRNFQVNSLVWLGVSYFFEDCHTSLQYLNKALDISRLVELKPCERVVESNILFVKNYWGQQSELPKTENKSEIAHFLIKNGKCEEGLRILENLEETPFRLYYRWLATKDVNYLYMALKEFKKNKSTFYIRELIEPEITRAGYDLIAN